MDDRKQSIMAGSAAGAENRASEERQQLYRLMHEILLVEKKQAGRIRTLMITNVILAAAILIVLGILVPRTVTMVANVQNASEHVQELSESAQESLDGINEMVADARQIVQNADQIVADADQVLVDNSDAVKAALENFNSVDFETLNKAIRDLSAAVEPLANLSHLFDK